MIGKFLSVLALGLLTVACTSRLNQEPPIIEPRPSSSGDSSAASIEDTAQFESLTPGDVFELKVFGEEELSGKFRVSGSGEVTLPLIGRLKVVGMGLTDFEELVVGKFKAFLKQPQVHVFVEGLKGRKVYVFGRVNKPGTMVYENGMSLIEVITKAGGLHDLAAAEKTTITRVVDGNEVKFEVSIKAIRRGERSNVLLYPGDIVFVPESVF